MKNKSLIFEILAITLLILSGIAMQIRFTSAAPAGTYCAEKTTYGASCQNVPLNQVNTKYNYAPTACESTTFCKTGTCVDRQEGNCFTNTPHSVCVDSGNVWYDAPPSAVPLCQQGCCLIGDQAAFVTRTRCQQLSSLYGMSTNFRTDLNNEISCIASAQPQAKGACVYETSTGRTCKFSTKQECQNMKIDGYQGATFHQGYLCSNPDLGTNCGPTKQTTCLPGLDQVYFIDSCGNPANVYDASKINNISYWSYVPGINGVSVSSGDNNGNIESKTNGNCDYYLGSTCRKYDKTIDGATNRPYYGDYICRDLNCNSGAFVQDFKNKYGRIPYNGESWCGRESSSGIVLGENKGLTGTDVSSLNKNSNLPGSRDVRFVCYNGIVSVEPCADYRQEICSQDTTNGINTASCVINRWRDCYSQTSERDCNNTDKRDCKWIIGISILKDSNGNPLVWDSSSDKLVARASSTDPRPQASCVPKYTPGFSSSEATQICSLANTNCIVTFTKSFLGKEGNEKKNIFGIGIKGGKVTCLNNNGTIVESWVKDFSNLCYSLGDCGVSLNYLGKPDYNNGDINTQFTITGNSTKK